MQTNKCSNCGMIRVLTCTPEWKSLVPSLSDDCWWKYDLFRPFLSRLWSFFTKLQHHKVRLNAFTMFCQKTRNKISWIQSTSIRGVWWRYTKRISDWDERIIKKRMSDLVVKKMVSGADRSMSDCHVMKGYFFFKDLTKSWISCGHGDLRAWPQNLRNSSLKPVTHEIFWTFLTC